MGDNSTSTTQRIPTGTPWVASYGYSRAVRSGTRIEVSGPTALDQQGNPVAPGDAYQQTSHALGIIEWTLAELGPRLDAVVRRRVFLRNIQDWPEFGRAHHEAFRDARPASSCVDVVELLLPQLLLEIEPSAVVSDAAD